MLLKSKFTALLFLASFMFVFTNSASAHCDSYDGPVIKDAEKALETNNVNLVLKWVTKEQEKEITTLFQKTYELRNGDKGVYEIVEKHFFETLVRLHRETEGAPYTGLKPAGTTKLIIQMTDIALKENNVEDLLLKLNNHIDNYKCNYEFKQKRQKLSVARQQFKIFLAFPGNNVMVRGKS